MAFKREVFSVAVIALLLASTLTVFNIQLIETGGSVSARANGLTDTPTAQVEQETGILSEAPPTEWTQVYGDADEQHAYSVVQTGDGGYALAGETVSYGGGGADFWLVRTDSSGNMLWSKTYGGSGGQIPYSMIQTSDGGYALAGYTSATPNFVYDFWLVKTDAAGNQLWSKTYGGLQHDVAFSVVQTSDGGYALAGVANIYSGSGAEDFLLVKTDSSGNMMWSKTYGGANADEAYSVVQTADAGYAIAGYTASYGAGGDFWLVKTDSYGNMMWSKNYGNTGGQTCGSLVLTSDGGYALAGATYYPTEGYLLVKTDSSGNLLWSKTYAAQTPYERCSLIRTTDGGYGLAARIGFDDPNFLFVKTDAAGNTMWDATYGGTAADGALSVIQTSDGGYAIAGYTCSYGAGSVDFWLVKIAPSNGGPPGDCGWPVLVAPVQISSSGGYDVGDTLTARFTIQNQGTAAIHLDKLLFGGRFNYGGTLPGGGFPDFRYSSVTLQVGQTFQYEGTLYLTEAGHYEFFVAYYIANPTEAERVRCALDPSNWNTCIDLAPGLTDNDRTWSVQVIVNPGNLRAVSIEPVQVVWGADLVQDKATDFKIGYESTFDVNVEANIRLDLPGFIPNSYEFKYNFAPGISSFVIGSVHGSSPFFLARTKPEATYRFSIDPDNLIVETDETDNTFPRADYEKRKVINTKPLSILFVPVRFDQEEGYPGLFTGFPQKWFLEHAEESVRYLRATYPLAESEVSYGTVSFSTPFNAGSKPGNKVVAALFRNNLLKKLTQLAINAKYDRVVGVVSSRFMSGIPGEEGTLGFTHAWGWGRASIVMVGCWNVLAHELGHTYGLSHSNYNGEGYYVAGRQWVMRQTFMATEDIEYPPVNAIYMEPVPRLWIRSEEYQKLLTAFREGVDPEALLAIGTVWLNGTVSLDYWYHLPTGTLDFEEGASGNYSIVQLDGVGNVLSIVRFNATFADVFRGELFDAMPFAFTIPYASGAKVIQILNATDHVVASRIISNNTPTVHVISPNGGEVLASESVQISWEGSDIDGDPIVCDLLISGDGGLAWNPIETGLTQTTYDLSLTGFPGGNKYIVKVISSDGVNTGEDVSDGFFTIASFATNVVTPPQSVSSGGKANYTLNITSYGGFSNPIVLNATSSTTDELVFRWINGSVILPMPNGSIQATLEIEVPYLTEGGNHTVFLSCISGNNTEVAIAYLFASSHDLAISHFTPSKTVVGQGFSMTVNVTVENQGNFGETFTVSLYGNQTLILEGSIYLPPQNLTTVTVAWNTSGFAKGNYTISVVADPVPGETYTADNTLAGGWVFFSIPGDINGDKTVDLKDVFAVAKAYGSTRQGPNPPGRVYVPNCDINGDDKIDLKDYYTTCKNFGKSW